PLRRNVYAERDRGRAPPAKPTNSLGREMLAFKKGSSSASWNMTYDGKDRPQTGNPQHGYALAKTSQCFDCGVYSEEGGKVWSLPGLEPSPQMASVKCGCPGI